MNWIEHPFYRAMHWASRLVGYQLLFWLALVAGFGLALTFPALLLLIMRLKEAAQGRHSPLLPWLRTNFRLWFWPAQRIGICWLGAAAVLLGWRHIFVIMELGVAQAASTALILIWGAVLPAWLTWRLESSGSVQALQELALHPGQLLALTTLLLISLGLAYWHPLIGAYTLLSLPLAVWLRLTRGFNEESVV